MADVHVFVLTASVAAAGLSIYIKFAFDNGHQEQNEWLHFIIILIYM